MRADGVLLVRAARGEPLTNKRARELTGLDRVEATRALQRLRRMGLLKQYGDRGGAEYRLAGNLAPPSGLRLSPAELEAAIVELAQEAPVTNAVVRERLGVDRSEALRLLDALVKQGRLVREGARRGARYVLPSE